MTKRVGFFLEEISLFLYNKSINKVDNVYKKFKKRKKVLLWKWKATSMDQKVYLVLA